MLLNENYFFNQDHNFELPSPLIPIIDERLDKQGVRLFLKRDDLIGKILSGNKYRKLYLNIAHFQSHDYQGIITYGGAFSNHIHAVAAAGKIYNIETHGIIRGEEPKEWSPTLLFAKNCGMQLHFASRQEYVSKLIHENLDGIQSKKLMYLPEGGTNKLAIQGCQSIVQEVVNTQFSETIDHWFVCCGTGGTAAGMISGMSEMNRAIGKLHIVQILKGDGMQEHIEQLLKDANFENNNHWSINQDYHFGGYAKWNKELITFMNDFKDKHNIALDPIYTGKMMYGIFDMVAKGIFEKGSTLMAIHTGGLQGIAGFNMRFGDSIIKV